MLPLNTLEDLHNSLNGKFQANKENLQSICADLMSKYFQETESFISSENDTDNEPMITKEEYEALMNPEIVEEEKKKETVRVNVKTNYRLQNLKKKEKKLQKEQLIEDAKEGLFTQHNKNRSAERRDFTVSIAIPGSVLSQYPNDKIRTLVAGQIARSAAIYRIDEIIVYNDDELNDDSKYLKDKKKFCGNENLSFASKALENLAAGVAQATGGDGKNNKNDALGITNSLIKEQPTFSLNDEESVKLAKDTEKQAIESTKVHQKTKMRQEKTEQKKEKSAEEKIVLNVSDPNVFLANILYYLEVPQYLRSFFFPMSNFLKHAGLLKNLGIPSHSAEYMGYRIGIVNLDGETVYCGLGKAVVIDQKMKPGKRVTVKISQEAKIPGFYHGTVVPDREPKSEGKYWGYHVRLADSLSKVFSEGPYQTTGGYDLNIGTAEDGKFSEMTSFKIPSFKHCLIVFGGPKGIAYAVENDPVIRKNAPQSLFDRWINTCFGQGVDYLRTEEAIYTTLASLNHKINKNVPPAGLALKDASTSSTSEKEKEKTIAQKK